MFDNLSFKKQKSFILSFLIVFVGVFLMNLGIRVPNVKEPISRTANQVANRARASVNGFDPIPQKLTQIGNNYSLIPSDNQAGTYQYAFTDSSAYAVIDYDSGKIIAQKNADQALPIASLTKLMTAVVALDLASPNDVFTLTPEAANQIPTKISMVPGQKMTLQELLDAALMTSANDAAFEIKEGVDLKYQKPVFVDAMNKKAQFLGMKNTYFSNSQGLDNPPGTHSSASDLAILTHYALTNYPLIADIVKRQYLILPQNENHKRIDLFNWNGLLGVYPNVLGVKIGNTEDAKVTTIVLAERENKKILVVLLGAPGTLERDMWAAQLLDLGFQKTLGLDPVNIDEQQLRAKYSTWQYWTS